jgi:Protein of unknown function (DUF2752)
VDGRYPTCPFLELTGWYCPGCGSLRALHALATGDPAGVVAHNALLPAGLVALGWAWLAWAGRRSGRWWMRPLQATRAVCVGIVAVLVGFAVLRNLPLEPFAALAP